MEISAADATSLLKKWFDERTPVKALWVSPNGLLTAKVTGFVNALAKDGGLIIADSESLDKSITPKNFFRIDHERTVAYEYLKTKDDLKAYGEAVVQYFTLVHGIANLSIRFDDNSRLSLFESNTARSKL